jgi:dTDP-4-amino-4,6-dideoxygalactose transaminase
MPDEIASLPMFPELQPEQIEHVVDSISAFYNDPSNAVQN